MKIANVVVAKKWGRGYKRVNLVMTVNEEYSSTNHVYYELVNAEHMFGMSVYVKSSETVTQTIQGSEMANEVEKRFDNGWFVMSYEVVEPTDPTDPTDPTEPTNPTEKEVAETAVAKLDSVVQTKHTSQVDRFYIHNYQNGVTRLYWFNKSALACGFKTIVNRDGFETVVRCERFRSFITWEEHRERYTKYCKSVALKGGE